MRLKGFRRMIRRFLTRKNLSTSLLSFVIFALYILLRPTEPVHSPAPTPTRTSPYVVYSDPVSSYQLLEPEDVCGQNISFVGREFVTSTVLDLPALERLSLFSDIRPGGTYIPYGCQSNYKVAVVIPYRNRQNHLIQYLYNVIPKLKRQNIQFTIIVVEQARGSNFNRGMMRNIGFKEAIKLQKFDCFVFNDVDTIPEDDRNLFKCNETLVRHLVSGADRYNYRIPYPELFGGIVAFNEDQFTKVNGYSNLFFVWGGEDDDLFRRVVRAGMMVGRPVNPIGLVTTLRHEHDPEVPLRYEIYYTVNETSYLDGLNSLMYKTINVEFKKLFTWIYVDVNERIIKRTYMRKYLKYKNMKDNLIHSITESHSLPAS